MKTRFLKRLFIILPLLLVSSFAFSAQAVEYGGVGGRPAYPDVNNPRTESIFVHTVNPGQNIQEGIKVVNNTAETKTLLVYAVDSAVSTDGAFACAQAEDGKSDVGSWVSLEKNEVTLDSLTNEVIPFTIQVPDNAAVGEHNGCIIVQEKKDVTANAEQTSGIQLSFRTGLRVALLVPGDIVRQLELTNFFVESQKNGNYLLKPSVHNSGNVSIDADVKVKVNYFFGALLEQFGGQYPILRGENSVYNFELKKPFWGGWYQSSFSVSYDANPEAGVGMRTGKELTVLQGPNIWFFAMPTVGGLIIEILVLLVILVLLYLWYVAIRRARWIKTKWVKYTVVAGDDIRKVAEAHKVSWKILAKGNKLSAPYTLTVGNTIKVPPSDD